MGEGARELAGAGQSGQTKNDPTKAFVKLGLKATGTDVTVTVDGVAQPTAAVHVGAAGLDVKVRQLSGSTSTIWTIFRNLSWIYAGIYMCGALPYLVCA